MKVNKIKKFISDNFSLETGVDITNDAQVLYRRNHVIKNIILLTNVLYTVLLFLLSLGEAGATNIVLTVILIPLTFCINLTLSKMINADKDNLSNQKAAMYIASIYILLSAVLIYIKLALGNNVFFESSGYLLIYYALMVTSLYQDKKLIKTFIPWVMVSTLILHFTVTYNVVGSVDNTYSGIWNWIIKSQEFRDIILKSFILLSFMVVLYIVASVGETILKERKDELLKRKSVEQTFITVTKELFSITLNNRFQEQYDLPTIRLFEKMSLRMALIDGFSQEEAEKVQAFSTIHIKNKNLLNSELDENESFTELSKKVEEKTTIIKRIKLAELNEELVRCHVEMGSLNNANITNTKNIAKDKINQIVLLIELYITLRGFKSYKRPYPHRKAIEVLEGQFSMLFEYDLFERFINYQNEFETIYNDF